MRIDATASGSRQVSPCNTGRLAGCDSCGTDGDCGGKSANLAAVNVHYGDQVEDMRLRELENTLQVGDIVFTRIRGRPFRKIAEVTGTWTNHVGIVVARRKFGVSVAESRLPVCCRTRFSSFVRRSSSGRVAVLRLPRRLSDEEVRRLQRAVSSRLGRLYDTGFNLQSRRQFCSRFVREVLQESTGLVIGETATFRDLLERNPETDLRLWKLWYFGHIPWERTTITPESLYASAALGVVFDGTVQRRYAFGRVAPP